MFTNYNFKFPHTIMKKIRLFQFFRFSISSKKIAMSKLAKSKASSLVKGKVSYHYLNVISFGKYPKSETPKI